MSRSPQVMLGCWTRRLSGGLRSALTSMESGAGLVPRRRSAAFASSVLLALASRPIVEWVVSCCSTVHWLTANCRWSDVLTGGRRPTQ